MNAAKWRERTWRSFDELINFSLEFGFHKFDHAEEFLIKVRIIFLKFSCKFLVAHYTGGDVFKTQILGKNYNT